MRYDIAIIGAGPGGLYCAYELVQKGSPKIAIFEAGDALENRNCPVVTGKCDKCVGCPSCSIMNGFGGAGAFSDGKYNITTQFGGSLEKIGRDAAYQLMQEVDDINMQLLKNAGEKKLPKIYCSKNSPEISAACIREDLHLLQADIRHLGTDKNKIILSEMYKELLEHGVDFYFNERVEDIEFLDIDYQITTERRIIEADCCVVSAGRSGSRWVQEICQKLDIPTISNKVDIGVRVELPKEVFEPLTSSLYESKIVYRTEKYQDSVRTFCMNPGGSVVYENTDGIITVNGHSYEDPAMHTENTNFALLVSKHFTEPFESSNDYGLSIAKLSNMLGGGVIVQRFGDLVRGQRSTACRINKSTVRPTLAAATPGDLSLVLPKRILDDIIEMVYKLNEIAPGTANNDTLLYGVEVKFYNMEVQMDDEMDISGYPGLYFIGDGSGITHSLAQASASGLHVAKKMGGIF